MSEGEEDKEEEMDDGPVLDGQEFIQEEYDLKLLLEATITRIDHRSMLKHASKSIALSGNPFSDEFIFFTDNLRKIFNQQSTILDQIIKQSSLAESELQPRQQLDSYLMFSE